MGVAQLVVLQRMRGMQMNTLSPLRTRSGDNCSQQALTDAAAVFRDAGAEFSTVEFIS